MTNSIEKNAHVLQERFAYKAASYLHDGVKALPYDVSERLRAARFQAVAVRKVAQSHAVSAVVNHSGAAALSGGTGEGDGWFARLGLVLPLVALVVGLFAINTIQSDNRAQELAEVDVALLTDALPPEAFSDPGFIQFLKVTP